MSETAEQNIAELMRRLGKRARQAGAELARATKVQKNRALETAARYIAESEAKILAANAKDM